MLIHPSTEMLTAIFTGVLACTGVAALLYAHLQLKEAHEQAQVQHLMSFTQQYEQEPMVAQRKLYAQKRLSGDEEPAEEVKLLDFFEMVGLLVKRDYLKDTDVWEVFAQDILPLHGDSREWIEQERKSDPATYSNFVLLVARLEDIEQEHHGTLANPSREDIKDFWKSITGEDGLAKPTVRRKRLSKKPKGHRT
jgi:hypothetical protein